MQVAVEIIGGTGCNTHSSCNLVFFFLLLAASKHALQGFFSSLRAEVAGSGISVTVVSPGYVSTALSLNAVNGDGSTYGKTDETTSKGMSASKLAETVLRGTANRRADLVVADAKTVAAIQMNTMLPELLAKIIRKK